MYINTRYTKVRAYIERLHKPNNVFEITQDDTQDEIYLFTMNSTINEQRYATLTGLACC